MKKQLLFYIIILLSIISCKKDDDETNPIYNNWTYISGGERYEDFYNLKYITIQPDNTISFLYEYEYGIRTCYEDLCQVINGQISFFGYYLFNFTIDGNNLILSDADVEIICEINGDEPSRQEWIQPMESLECMDAPVEAQADLAFDGEFIWSAGFKTYSTPAQLYKIHTTTLSVVQNLPTTNWPIGIEWADGYIWTSSNGYSNIYKVDPATGSNLFTSVNMGSWVSGIAYDGQYLWCGANASIYQYEPNINACADTLWIGCQLGGMAYADNYLYVVANGVLNKCTIDPLEFVSAYDIEMGYIYGIAYDGNDFWIYASFRNEAPYYRICKVSW